MKNRRLSRWLVVTVLAASATASAHAAEIPRTVLEQLRDFHRSWVAEGSPASSEGQWRPKFGVDATELVNVHAYDFQANTSSDLILDDGNGYRYFGAPGVPYMAAPLRLPAGVNIDALRLSYCAANAGDLVIALYDNGFGGAGGLDMIAGPLTSDAGCQVQSLSTNYLYYTTGLHPLYLVVYFAGNAYDGSTKFNNASVAFRRQVWEGPTGSPFTDVLVTDFGFRYITALAYSGIAAGCGDDLYCPDSPVTRRQMAIFITKALGLYWPE